MRRISLSLTLGAGLRCLFGNSLADRGFFNLDHFRLVGDAIKTLMQNVLQIEHISKTMV
jgi:hypothetical protein